MAVGERQRNINQIVLLRFIILAFSKSKDNKHDPKTRLGASYWGPCPDTVYQGALMIDLPRQETEQGEPAIFILHEHLPLFRKKEKNSVVLQCTTLMHAPALCPFCPLARYSLGVLGVTWNRVHQQSYKQRGKHSRPGKAAAIHWHPIKGPTRENRHLEILQSTLLLLLVVTKAGTSWKRPSVRRRRFPRTYTTITVSVRRTWLN